MPRFVPLLRSLEEHLKQRRRARLRHRAITVIAQDRVDTLAATTGWRPPSIITGKVPPEPPPPPPARSVKGIPTRRPPSHG